MFSSNSYPEQDETSRRILDAVREEVLAFGMRRATMTSIANRAQVSRVTLYRRGTDLRDLILDALVREFQEFLGGYITEKEPQTGRDAVVQMCVGSVFALAKAPLFESLRRNDPEIFVPYLVDRIGRNQRMLLSALTPTITAGIADGSIRNQDPAVLALILMQALTTFGLGTHLISAEIAEESLRAELTHLVNGYLVKAPK